jgi:hypothetical protein
MRDQCLRSRGDPVGNVLHGGQCRMRGVA